MALSGLVEEENVEAVLGAKIEEGSARIVYAYDGENSLVIKKGKYPPYISNFTEWIIWSQIAETERAAIFGACYALSRTGLYLIMERLDSLQDTDAMIGAPVWTTDSKRSAQGRNAANIIKIRDYGTVALSRVL
ncbi:hypothetical protein [Niveispirillum sp.]|uniref:hypothetical protein n=1 Tax=Niveispirillum sp. TaxID=1917217 RepID=UPI001B783263|nr:hypothetical protein [Niveispirillum sp.]MBP7338635.1 hypothetical protein [Niveispirillum sp.]